MNRRDPALEIFRGIAICEVVIHHVSGFARTNVHPATSSHVLYAVLNRTLHFAVPAFLFLMALLLTLSMRDGKRGWKEFFSRRAAQTLYPYLLWSGLFGLFQAWIGKVAPSALADAATWGHWLLWGKAWYHLYFLVLALQLYLLFPLVFGAMRRLRPGLAALLAAAAGIQLLIYAANRWWVQCPYPSALLGWHALAVLAGIWTGLNFDTWDAVWRRLRPAAVTLMVVGGAVYLPLGLRELRGLPLDTFTYQASFWAYTTGVCFCLLAFSRFLARRAAPAAARALQALGAQSMQIYLVHPLLLYFWYRSPQAGSTLRYHLTVLVVTSLTMAGSLFISRLAARTSAGRVLFGRGDVPMAPLPARAPRPKPLYSAGGE